MKVNGLAVSTASQLAEQIAREKPGDKVKVTFLRSGQEKSAEVILKSKLGTFASQSDASIESLGAEFSTVNIDDLAKLGIDGGVQVTKIHGTGVIGSQTNMRLGFIITRIGNIPVKSVNELKEALSQQSGNFQIVGVYPGSDELYYYGINDFKK